MSNVNHKNKRNINGILLLDKPIGITSNASLQKVKWLYNARKAGHTGSLDPLASGMLPICFGEATKFSQFLLDADKHYRVTAKLGITTTTDDAEGEVLETRPVSAQLTTKVIENSLKKFRGPIAQIPSMYSAIKRNGQPLYKLARQGIEIEREPRPVNIYQLDLCDFSNSDNSLNLDIVCSKGTYVRTLVADIGQDLGCGAHVSTLHRASVGKYAENQLVTLQTLENLHANADLTTMEKLLIPIESIFDAWQEVQFAESIAYYLRQGQPVIIPRAPAQGWVKLKTKDGRFIGVGEILSDGRVAPKKLMR